MTIPRDQSTRDGPLDIAWRSASGEEPSSAADDSIRAAARRAVQSGPQTSAPGPRLRRPNQRAWWPLAAAATVAAITLGITQFTPPDNDWNAQPIGAPIDAPAATQPGSLAPMVENREPQADSRESKAVYQKPKAEGRAPQGKSGAPTPTMSAKKMLDDRTADAFAAPPPLGLAQQGAALRKDQSVDAFALPPSAAITQQGLAPRGGANGAVDAGASATAASARNARQPQAEDAAILNQATRTERAAKAPPQSASRLAGAPVVLPAPAAQPVPHAISATPAMPTFEAWVSAIQQLLRDGQNDTARRETMRLAEAYPDRVQGLSPQVRALLPATVR